MSGALKKTTGLAGLTVSKKPHHALEVVYGKLLRALDKLPQNVHYRQTTEPLIREKLNYVRQESNIANLEKKLGYQVEECIAMAERELNLARQFAIWKPWQPLATHPPPDQWKWPL